MYLNHGLFIPELKHLSSLEAFIGYLATLITEYNECLYCGSVKASKENVQSHMRDTGHCMLNLDREPELLEFWDFTTDAERDSETEAETPLSKLASKSSLLNSLKRSDDTIQLPSGAIVGLRKAGQRHRSPRHSTQQMARQTIKQAEDQSESSTEISVSSRSQDTRMMKRGELGLLGVSDQQKRILLAGQRKFQKKEAVIKAAEAWVTERAANKQKHYRVSAYLPGICFD
jgi:pre-60S factor REI1